MTFSTIYILRLILLLICLPGISMAVLFELDCICERVVYCNVVAR